MKVAQYTLVLGSQHQLSQTVQVHQQLTVLPPQSAIAPAQETVSVSDAGKRQLASDGANQLDPHTALLKALLEKLFHVYVQLLNGAVTPADDSAAATTANQPADVTPAAAQGGTIAGTSAQISAQEALQFSASGTITTQDGRAFSFALNVGQQSSITLDTSSTVRSGSAAKDPLLLTLDGGPAEFAGATVKFQLTPGADAANLPMPVNGGWLVWDRNGNGQVDNGSELFGPTSGNGFADLAALDSNGDGVLDDSDPLFAQLALWEGRPDGADKLVLLKSLGIGAIMLRNVAAPFNYLDGNGAAMATERRAGVYLREDGQAGLVSQVDVSV
jgi:hypothetical protein